jgi:hypothetical protein
VLNFQVASDVLQQLQHSRHLSLGEQVDLQVQMTTLIGLARASVLTGEDEQRQEIASRPSSSRKEMGTDERPNSADCAGIHGYPRAELDDVKNEDSTA